ncbi:MAG TPA: hypothetical protein VIG24_14810 [Acidimicrobiia bacterium]
MPISSGQIAVGTVATEIPETCTMPFRLEIHNDDNTDDLYIGGSGVTTTTGMKVNKLEQLQVRLAPLDRVYCVSSKNGHNVSYIAFRQC